MRLPGLFCVAALAASLLGGCSKPVVSDADFLQTVAKESENFELDGFPESSGMLARQNKLALTKDKDGNTPLLLTAACYKEKSMGLEVTCKSSPAGVAFMEQLLSAGADLKASDSKGRTALHRASEGGGAPYVALLLSKGADVNAKDKSGHTPLSLCSSSGTEEILRQHGGR